MAALALLFSVHSYRQVNSRVLFFVDQLLYLVLRNASTIFSYIVLLLDQRTLICCCCCCTGAVLRVRRSGCSIGQRQCQEGICVFDFNFTFLLSLIRRLSTTQNAIFMKLTFVGTFIRCILFVQICNYIKQRSADFQCVVISLKEMFFEHADCLVGICKDVDT